MNEQKRMLGLLQVVVPPETLLTVSSEVKILELLGIVSTRAFVTAMQIAAALVPDSTPATLKGLVQMLTGLMKTHPKATKAHHGKINELLTGLDTVPDVQLTFGTFLPICQALLDASPNARDAG
jgi:hypothetical protein